MPKRSTRKTQPCRMPSRVDPVSAGLNLRVQAAVHALRSSGVVACPTEAVWGLSCDPWSETAVARLLDLKERPVEKGVILVAADMGQLEFLLEGLSVPDRDKLAATWPGPVTWLVPHHGRIPAWVHGVHPTVAVRVSAHPVVRELCRAFGGPLVSTSANKAGAQPPREAFQVHRYFQGQLDEILPGRVGKNARPSTILDLNTGNAVRV